MSRDEHGDLQPIFIQYLVIFRLGPGNEALILNLFHVFASNIQWTAAAADIRSFFLEVQPLLINEGDQTGQKRVRVVPIPFRLRRLASCFLPNSDRPKNTLLAVYTFRDFINSLLESFSLREALDFI